MKSLLTISLVLAIIAYAKLSDAFYSLNFFSGKAKFEVVNTGTFFRDAPSALHVADIYARISGLAPILREDHIALPAANILTSDSQKPFLLEVHGGRLPLSVKPIISASAFTDNKHSPKLEQVTAALATHGIQVQSRIVDASEDIEAIIESFDQPVIILHHEVPSSQHYIHRSLTQSKVRPLTEFEISDYQICLWTGVVMVLLVLSSVCAIINMEVIPDSLLVAKFLAQRTGKHD